MNSYLTKLSHFRSHVSLVIAGMLCFAADARSADRQKAPVNAAGAAVRSADGRPVNYSRAELSGSNAQLPRRAESKAALAPSPQAFIPTTQQPKQPFWQYSIFGSGIGVSNIIIAPAAVPGAARQIVVGGNSGSNFGSNDFWQILQHNPTSGNYDQVFVSRLYDSAIMRIGLGNVRGDANQELVVMLEDGRIYLYDFASRVELGHIDTGVSGLAGLSLTDLNGLANGYSELIVTSETRLLVFDGEGDLLWQVDGAGGREVVACQMDTDPAIEIATTSGTVVDAGTRKKQWTRSGGFGVYLKLAPLPGASYQQLVAAEGWDNVFAYDVAKQLPRWSMSVFDIDALEIADVDNDGTPEIIIGDGQWGSVHVHDLKTRAQKWEVQNPEHGVTNIAVGDVDNDGVVDLLFGAGWTSTGSDYLYVASTTGAHAIKWQSVDLNGPFLGPVIGDLDGDGQTELVVCSFQSESGYDSGRILVFDRATLTLRAMSAPVVNNRGWTGVHDLKLCDLEGDGQMEIALATSDLYDGVIEIYGFDASNNFTVEWTNTTRPSGSPFNFVEVADLDGDGQPEIITGNSVAHTGSEGVYVYIFDYPATANPWRSVNMGSGFSSLSGLVVRDLDGNGTKEIAALNSAGELYTFNGAKKQLVSLRQDTGATLLATRHNSTGLILGDDTGLARFWRYKSAKYFQDFTRQLAPTELDGVHALPGGQLWSGSEGILSLRIMPWSEVRWQSSDFGDGFGRYVATDVQDEQTRVFSSARHAVAGFVYQLTESTTLANISTRLRVETGDNALIGGFIINGEGPKRVLLRAIGPSLGVDGSLGNPQLQLFNSDRVEIDFNDNWESEPNSAEIIATMIPPEHPLESAILRELAPGAYTAVVRGVDNSAGIGLVEVYDLDTAGISKLANISTRGRVQLGDNVMIGGFIVTGPQSQKVIIRAIGPSLAVSDKLPDPMLQLFDADGTLLQENDNWRSHQQAAIVATGVAPSSDLEAAIVRTLPPAPYTAIVRDAGDATGVGLVEVFALIE